MDRPSLLELVWTVARDVNRTFGGGYASMELLRLTFTRAGWLDAPGNALLVAVSRLTPGTNILAYCVGLGWRLQRTAGAVAALVAGSLPASILVVFLTSTVAQINQYRSVQILLAIGTAVAVVLVFSAAWSLLRPYLTRPHRGRAATIVLLSAVLLAFDLTPVRTLLIAAAVGVLVLPGLSTSPGAHPAR